MRPRRHAREAAGAPWRARWRARTLTAVSIAAHVRGFDFLHAARTELGWLCRRRESSNAAALTVAAISWMVVIEPTSLGTLAPRSVAPVRAYKHTSVRQTIGLMCGSSEARV